MVTLTRLAGALGADVHGLDLSRPLDPDGVRLVREALLDHQVLFFREQPFLTPDQHRALCRHFGELEVNPFQPDGADPTLLVLDQLEGRNSEGANFHADSTFRPHPPMGAILQAHVLPENGGDTCFSSMTAAYDALSQRMQTFLDGLEAWHSLEQMAMRLASSGGAKLQLDLARFAPVKHPVIANHPETGQKLINVNYNWTTHIDGLPMAESRTILEFLYDHVRNPEFQVRMRWRPGDITFWDNRVTQHYAVPDYQGRRLMHRVAIAGAP
jgi:taurine dioxygenase